jgi:hypothetical protein
MGSLSTYTKLYLETSVEKMSKNDFIVCRILTTQNEILFYFLHSLKYTHIQFSFCLIFNDIKQCHCFL